MTSRVAEIVSPYHRRENRIYSAAIRWPDFGGLTVLGSPFGPSATFGPYPEHQCARTFKTAQCPLWVISGPFTHPPIMSAFGGKADIPVTTFPASAGFFLTYILLGFSYRARYYNTAFRGYSWTGLQDMRKDFENSAPDRVPQPQPLLGGGQKQPFTRPGPREAGSTR